MIVRTIPVGDLQCNCTVLVDEVSREAIVVDPGDEAERVLEVLAELGAAPRYLVHTHAHLDHVQGTRHVKAASGGEIGVHEGDLWLWQRVPMQGAMFGMRAESTVPPDIHLAHGDVLRFGSERLHVIHTPGHTPGSLCFLHEEGKLLLSGDTLFNGSIGRTDLWGGDGEQILDSIEERLLSLDGDIRVVCGHGPDTTIATERRSNPFVGHG